MAVFQEEVLKIASIHLMDIINYLGDPLHVVLEEKEHCTVY